MRVDEKREQDLEGKILFWRLAFLIAIGMMLLFCYSLKAHAEMNDALTDQDIQKGRIIIGEESTTTTIPEDEDKDKDHTFKVPGYDRQHDCLDENNNVHPCNQPGHRDLPKAESPLQPKTESLQQPNDPKFGEQWNVIKMGLTESYKIPCVNPVIIGLVDTGILDNPDLNKARIIYGCDHTKSGCQLPIDDTLSWSHGTALAGIMMATQNNGVLMTGYSNCIRILVEKVCYNGLCEAKNVAHGITHAVNNGAKIINVSIAGPFYDYDLYKALVDAVGKGAVVVCAAGDEGSYNVSTPIYPAIHKQCTTIGSTYYDGTIITFGDHVNNCASSYGSNMFAMAPGVYIWSLDNSDTKELVEWNCTSVSAAQVSALIAMVMNANPRLKASQAKQIVGNSAHHPISGEEYHYGHGEINPPKALLMARQPTFQRPAPPPLPCGKIYRGLAC